MLKRHAVIVRDIIIHHYLCGGAYKHSDSRRQIMLQYLNEEITRVSEADFLNEIYLEIIESDMIDDFQAEFFPDPQENDTTFIAIKCGDKDYSHYKNNIRVNTSIQQILEHLENLLRKEGMPFARRNKIKTLQEKIVQYYALSNPSPDILLNPVNYLEEVDKDALKALNEIHNNASSSSSSTSNTAQLVPPRGIPVVVVPASSMVSQAAPKDDDKTKISGAGDDKKTVVDFSKNKTRGIFSSISGPVFDAQKRIQEYFLYKESRAKDKDYHEKIKATHQLKAIFYALNVNPPQDETKFEDNQVYFYYKDNVLTFRIKNAMGKIISCTVPDGWLENNPRLQGLKTRLISAIQSKVLAGLLDADDMREILSHLAPPYDHYKLMQLLYLSNQTLHGHIEIPTYKNEEKGITFDAKSHAEHKIKKADKLRDIGFLTDRDRFALKGNSAIIGNTDLKRFTLQNIAEIKLAINQNAVLLNTLIQNEDERLELYAQCNYGNNKNIEAMVLNQYNYYIDNWFWKFFGDKELKKQTKNNITALMQKLMNCRTEIDYIKFLEEALRLVENSLEHSWEEQYLNTISDACLKVVDTHMLNRNSFGLSFTAAQLSHVKILISSITDVERKNEYLYTNAIANLDSVIDSKREKDAQSALLDHQHGKMFNPTSMENSKAFTEMEKEENIRKKIKLFEDTIVDALSNRFMARKVMSTGDFVLTGKDLSTIGAGLCALAGLLNIPGGGALDAALKFADQELQIHTAHEIDNALSNMSDKDKKDKLRDKYGSVACYEQLMRKIARILSHSLYNNIAKMKGDSVTNFGLYYVEQANDAIDHILEEKSDDEDFVDYMVKAMFQLRKKLTKNPFVSKDYYENEDGTKGSYQTLVKNVIFLKQSNANDQIEYFATETSLGVFKEENGEMISKPKFPKYDFAYADLLSDNIISATHRHRLTVTETGPDANKSYDGWLNATSRSVALNHSVMFKDAQQKLGKCIIDTAEESMRTMPTAKVL